MEEREENKTSSFKSCLKWKEHPGGFLLYFFVVLGFFPPLGNFLETQMKNHSFTHWLFGLSHLSCSSRPQVTAFLIAVFPSQMLEHWEVFLLTSNIGGSFQFFT